MTPDTLDTLKRSAAIPSLPQVVTRFLEVIRDPAFDFDDVADVLSADPGMTADMLRLVNSPLFGVTRTVSSLHQALSLLGLRRVRSLVLGRYLVDSLSDSAAGGVDQSYFWRRSLAAGVLTARFVDVHMPAVRDEAFIGGLLCDTGIMILADALPAYAPVAEKYAPHQGEEFCSLEVGAVGIAHPEATAAVLDYWQLPELVTTAIRYHHSDEIPDELPSDMATIARALNGAGRIAKLLCETADPDRIREICRDAMDVVGLDVSVLVRCLGEVENEIRDLADVLHIDIIPSRVYEMLAEEISKDVAEPAAAT